MDFKNFNSTTEICDFLQSVTYESILFAVDIGGTNLRYAFGVKYPNSSDTTTLLLPSHRTSDANTVVELLKGLAFDLHRCFSSLSIDRTVVSVAGPVDQSDIITLTNFTGSKTLLKSSLPAILFPAGKTFFMNDLVAACHGILTLNRTKTINTYFQSLWTDSTCELSDQNYVVAMCGTGLGIGILLHTSSHFLVVPSEYGHSTLALTGPSFDAMANKEEAFASYLSTQLYDNHHMPEFEDAVSGRGLEKAFQFLSGERVSAGEIGSRAIEGDKMCIDAQRLFYRLLFRAIQQICVGLRVQGDCSMW
ncbi:hypothetical protein GEMRC1_013810 [Eukaryota sp. GEM-RC1]